MPQITYLAAISIDGRMVGVDGEPGFLEALEQSLADSPFRPSTLCAAFDSVLMGARTFETLAARLRDGRQAAWPYPGKPAWVATHAASLAPPSAGVELRRFCGAVRELGAELAAAGLRRTFLVGGADLAAQLLAADLVDELILGVAPALLGRGPRLVAGSFPARRYALVAAEPAGAGLALRYRRAA
jgi:dihydrofolate reductase